MAAASPVLNQINRWLSQVPAVPDAELVGRFATRRDEDAFAEIVDRHGPMVLGVARRVTGTHHLAEEVFQATFLTLARRARDLRRPASLTAWLHQTTYRLALTAVRAKKRRRRAETIPAVRSQTDPLADLSAREVVTIIDDELRRLPETLRQPLVLCCLEGRSQDEAAALLGWTPGSVRGRLERGRQKLAARLARGLTLAMTFSADGRLVCGRVSVGASANKDDFDRGEHHVWEVATGARITRFTAKHAGRMTFSPDNRMIAYATGYGVHVVELVSGQLTAEYEDPGINCANYGFTGPS
jgi:RNA polymerase sigma factor (sigma-70 family)